MAPFGVDIKVPSSLNTPLQVFHRAEDQDSSFDLCAAHIVTPWFIATDAHHRIKPTFHLMTTPDGQVVTSFAGSKESQCLAHPLCSSDLSLANKIQGGTERVFRNDDFVFHTSQVNAYCDLWKIKVSHEEHSPSATSFVAFLQEAGDADNLYIFVDRMRYGSRDMFVPVLEKTSRQNRVLQITNVTAESCVIQTTVGACIEQDCEWRPAFSACRDFLNREVIDHSEAPIDAEDGNNIDRGRYWSPVVWFFIILAIALGVCAICFLITFVLYRVATSYHQAPADEDEDMMADIVAPDLLSRSTSDNVPSMSAFLTNPPVGYHYNESYDSIELLRDGSVVQLE
jgi:hypothetical protein